MSLTDQLARLGREGVVDSRLQHLPSAGAQKVLGWFGGYGFGGKMGVFTQ